MAAASMGPFWGGPSWGGPSWGGPSWGGPSWGGPSRGGAGSALSVQAMVQTGELLMVADHGQQSMPANPVVQPAWSGLPGAGVVQPDAAPRDRTLFGYEASVRQALVAGELVSQLAVTGGAQAVVLADRATTVASLASPAAYLAREVEHVVAVSQTLYSVASGGPLSTLVAQDGDPLVPFAFLLGLTSAARPRTVELVGVATEVLGLCIFSLKHRLGVRRPHELSSRVVPVLDVPTHLSCPGGHAAKAWMAATLLKALVGPRTAFADRADALAALVGENRVLAGLHYPVDNAAGEVLGRAFGHWLLAVADERRSAPWTGAELVDVGGASPMLRRGRSQATATPDVPSWRQLYAEAAAEWA